jgi:hypothetical protein
MIDRCRAGGLGCRGGGHGCPFWFDALNRLVNLRNTWKIPESKT